MSISFNCPICDHRLKVPDEAAGKRGKCPACGEKVTIPLKAIQSPEPSEVVSHRPFWRDPIIMSGVGFSLVVLAGFFVYLLVERSGRVFREHITALKAEADQLSKDGRKAEAFSQYDEVLSYVGNRDPGDPQSRAEIAAVRRARDELRTAHEADLIRQKTEEQRLIAAEKQRSEMEALNKTLEEAAKKEQERLARISEAAQREQERLARILACSLFLGPGIMGITGAAVHRVVTRTELLL